MGNRRKIGFALVALAFIVYLVVTFGFPDAAGSHLVMLLVPVLVVGVWLAATGGRRDAAFR